MKKVLFVATVVKTHIMEFHIPYLQMFKKMGWETAVAAKNDYENQDDCNIPYCDNFFNIPFERNPIKFENIKAYTLLKKVIKEGNYNIIHCHTPVGAMLTRLAVYRVGKHSFKVIYTAHGFHFYEGASWFNWIFYYPIERMLARMTDILITINKEDYQRARTFKAGEVCYIPGIGIDMKRFHIKPGNRKKKRKDLGVKEEDFILLSVGELIARKNHEIVIRALGYMKRMGTLDHIQYLICGEGRLKEWLRQLCKKNGVDDRVHFLGYRNDIPEICNCSDLFVFMSRQEGLPVALMEAMACGIPVVCSDIRGNSDLIKNGVSGIIAQNTARSVSDSILEMKEDPAIREKYTMAALDEIKKYDLSITLKIMRDIYIQD